MTETIKLFVSSTFEDLSLERRFLAEVIFPEFRRRALSKRIAFYEIDLRWGVQGDAPIIKTCLREIELTRPFFIGIIGASDGTIPTIYDFEKEKGVFEEYNQFIQNCIEHGYSITEMEIRYGILNNLNRQRARFFWLDYTSHTNKQIQLYKDLESHGFIIEHCSSLENLGKNISAYLSSLIEDFKTSEDCSIIEKFRNENLSILNNLLVNQLDRSDIDFGKVRQFISSEKQLLILSGEKGVGKTSVLAKIIKELQPITNYHLIYHFYTGGYIDDIYTHLQYEFEEILGTTFNEYAENNGLVYVSSPKDKCLCLFNLLTSNKVLIILDGLDKFPGVAETFLASFFKNSIKEAKFIITIDADIRDFAFNNIEYQSIAITFPKEMLPSIIEAYYTPFDRPFPNELISNFDKSIFKWTFDSLLVVLNELRTFAVHRNLEYSLNSFLSISEKELYNQIVSHWQEVLPYISKKHILEYIALSHYGVTESDLQKICKLTTVEYSFAYSLILPYIDKVGERIYLRNARFREVILSKITDEVPYREKLQNYYIEQNNSENIFDEALYQAALLNNPDKVVSILMDLDIFHFAYNNRLSELFKYWSGLDDDDIEYSESHIVLNGYNLNTLVDYIHLNAPKCYNISKEYVLKELIEFIQFYLKPYFNSSWECHEVCSKIADYIYSNIKRIESEEELQEILIPCIQVYSDDGDTKKQQNCFNIINKPLQKKLADLIRFHNNHIQMREALSTEWKNSEPKLSIDYPYNILNIKNKIRKLTGRLVSYNVEIIATHNNIKVATKLYRECNDIIDSIKNILDEIDYYSYMATLEYSIGLCLHNGSSYNEALIHLDDSFRIRINHLLPSNATRYWIDRLFECYKLITSCQVHLQCFEIEKISEYCVGLETYGAEIRDYKYQYLIGQAYLNCGAYYFNLTLNKTITEEQKVSCYQNAIENYSKSILYINDMFDMNDIIKARYFRAICYFAIGKDYEEDFNYVKTNVNKVEFPNEMTTQIKNLMLESGII